MFTRSRVKSTRIRNEILSHETKLTVIRKKEKKIKANILKQKHIGKYASEEILQNNQIHLKRGIRRKC